MDVSVNLVMADEVTIPKKTLKEIEEFANGAYFLLTFSSEGRPVAMFFNETEKDGLALEAALERYMDKLAQERFKEEKEEGDED